MAYHPETGNWEQNEVAVCNGCGQMFRSGLQHGDPGVAGMPNRCPSCGGAGFIPRNGAALRDALAKLSPAQRSVLVGAVEEGIRRNASEEELASTIRRELPDAPESIVSLLLQHPNSVPLAAWLTFVLTLMAYLRPR